MQRERGTSHISDEGRRALAGNDEHDCSKCLLFKTCLIPRAIAPLMAKEFGEGNPDVKQDEIPFKTLDIGKLCRFFTPLTVLTT